MTYYIPGCKENHFQSFSIQLGNLYSAAGMFYPKSHFNQPPKKLLQDYSSSEILITELTLYLAVSLKLRAKFTSLTEG